MSLILPGGPAFTFQVDSLTATPNHARPGTQFTFGASDADGAIVTLLSALARDLHHLVIHVGGASTGSEDNSATVDILVDPAGGTSWTTLIDKLVAGGSPGAVVAMEGLTHRYEFPLTIPAGASVGIRGRKTGATANTDGRCYMLGYGEPKRPGMWWSGRKVETLGAGATASKGTAHTPGANGTYSSFATIGTSTRRYGAIQLGVNHSDAVATGLSYHWQLGVSSTRLAGSPIWVRAMGTAEIGSAHYPGLVGLDIPSSTALQVRATSSGTSPETFDVMLYGVY